MNKLINDASVGADFESSTRSFSIAFNKMKESEKGEFKMAWLQKPDDVNSNIIS